MNSLAPRAPAGKPAAPPVRPCRRCGSGRTSVVLCEGGPHHARESCADCGKFVRFIPHPMTPERAAGYVLHFGKHAGRTLDDILGEPSGADYLEWLYAQPWIKPTLRLAVATVLQSGRAIP